MTAGDGNWERIEIDVTKMLDFDIGLILDGLEQSIEQEWWNGRQRAFMRDLRRQLLAAIECRRLRFSVTLDALGPWRPPDWRRATEWLVAKDVGELEAPE